MAPQTKIRIRKKDEAPYTALRPIGRSDRVQARNVRFSGKRIWAVVALFLIAVTLVITGIAVWANRQGKGRQAAVTYHSQPLSGAAYHNLQVSPLQSEDYLIGGNLNVAGVLGVNAITSSADMLIGTTKHRLLLQGNDVSLVNTVGGVTNSLRFATPEGTNKIITLPNASGTVAVSATGPLVLDAKGNLSCPSCTAVSASPNVTNVTNNLTYVTNNNITNVTTGVSSMNAVAGDVLLQGTANQVVVNTDATSKSITLSLPQDINNGASPVFANMNIGHTLQAGSLNAASATLSSTLSVAGATTLGQLTTSDVALFKNTINSSTAFQVQDSAGTALLNADTAGGTVSIGKFSPTTVYTAGTTTTANYAVGSYPNSTAVGDFNGDGKVDIAIANGGANTISILMNNGNGTFAPKVDYATGGGPSFIKSADLNGDGKPDLVVYNGGGSNTLSVFMNNGNGTFAAPVNYATGANPSSIAIGDFNGDGKFDIAVSNYDAKTISILVNNGNGTFAPKVDVSTSTSPNTVSAIDVNGDGKPDLVEVSSPTNTISVFMNNGNGTFAAPVNYIGAAGAYYAVGGDLNGDGKADLVVTNQNSNNVSVFMNNGNGTFAAPVNYATGANPSIAVLGDFNNDGKLDIAVNNYLSNSVSVLMNNGNGTFAPAVNYTTGSGPYAIAAADFNGDGQLDIAAPNIYSNTSSVILLGVMTGTTVVQPSSRLTVNTAPNAIGQLIQGTAGQTADLLQVRDNINNTLLNVGATGNVAMAGSLSISGNITASSALNVAGLLTGSGNVLFKNATNSTASFQVQQASGTAVFGVDTTNGRIGVGVAAPNNKVSVNSLTIADGLAQVAIGTAATTNKGIVVQGVLNQTADLLQAQSSTGAILASISATGALTVASATVTGSITINGHVITGGTTPTIAAGTAACSVPTVSIVGNDTSGKVTITTGTGCTLTGTLATVTFNTAFGTAPRIIMTPSNANAANLKMFTGNSSTTTFTIDTATAPIDATAYTFNYWAVQ